jgi:hypothetical protein
MNLLMKKWVLESIASTLSKSYRKICQRLWNQSGYKASVIKDFSSRKYTSHSNSTDTPDGTRLQVSTYKENIKENICKIWHINLNRIFTSPTTEVDVYVNSFQSSIFSGSYWPEQSLEL